MNEAELFQLNFLVLLHILESIDDKLDKIVDLLEDNKQFKFMKRRD